MTQPDILNNRDIVLDKKAEILRTNPKAFLGNTKNLKDYKQIVTENFPSLTDFQEEAALGLILGDASIRTNNDGTSTGLTCQQSLTHDDWMVHLLNVFQIYVVSDKVLPPPLNGRDIRELTTLKVVQFNKIAKIITDQENLPFPGNKKLNRVITDRLYDYITPVLIAYLFGSDGSKVNAGTRSLNQPDGKGIRLHLQSFSEKDLKNLSEMINQKLNFFTEVKRDSRGTNDQHYVLDFPGKDYDKFIEIVGPYIHKSMHYKVPLGRSNNSRYGKANQDFVDKHLGKFLLTSDYAYIYKK